MVGMWGTVSPMNRLFLLAALLVVAASCASASTETVDQSVTTIDQPSSPSTTVVTVAPETSSTSRADESPADSASRMSGLAGTTTTPELVTEVATAGPPPEGPSAPDFTLSLGADGAESFTLSAEVNPVFIVFWAEW